MPFDFITFPTEKSSHSYSLLRASIGFRAAALLAGAYPKNNPIATETEKETITAEGVGVASRPATAPTAVVATLPRPMPMMPPMAL